MPVLSRPHKICITRKQRHLLFRTDILVVKDQLDVLVLLALLFRSRLGNILDQVVYRVREQSAWGRTEAGALRQTWVAGDTAWANRRVCWRKAEAVGGRKCGGDRREILIDGEGGRGERLRSGWCLSNSLAMKRAS
jgi:hypothetical protein